MTTLPPYPGPSDLEREALAEEARQAALPDSPQAWRNKRIFILIVIAFLASLLFFGLLTGYRVAGWFGMIAFAILWLVPSALMMAADDGLGHTECAGDVRMILAKGNDELRHEVVILRAQLLDCQITTAAQAEVIKAQRVNLDVTRKAMHEVLKPDCQCWVCKMLRAALEGVEPEEK